MPISSCLRSPRALAVLIFCSLAGAALAQVPSAGLEKSGDFRVLIDATGKLKSAAPLDASLGDQLNRALVGAAKDIVFEPAMRDGAPASFETQMHVTGRFVSLDGGGYKLELASAWLAPQVLVRKNPLFPRGMDVRKVEAIIAVRVAIAADGSVDPARTTVLKSAIGPGQDAARAPMERATLDAVLQTRYQPDLLAGKPVATELLQVYRFCVDGCSLAEPPLEAEREQYPRIVDTDARAARVPAALVRRDSSLPAKPLRFRIGIDALGNVTSVSALEGGDPALLERTRTGLRALHFFPATDHGRAVSSEMPVSVPVRIANGSPQPQLARLGLEFGTLSFPRPRLSGLAGVRDGEIHARMHIVTTPTGHADKTASGIESLELIPAGPVVVERTLRKQFQEAINQSHVEPVLVDGRGISLEFWRSYFTPFCIAATRCNPGPGAMAPADPPVKLPEGIELARVKP